MATERVVIKPKGIEAVLKSVELQNELARKARNVQRAAGDGFDVFEFVGHDRAHAIVQATSWAGFRAEHDDRALSKAIDAAAT